MRLNAYCGNLLWQSNLTLQAPGYTTDYVPFAIDAEAFAKAVRKGDNVLAVKIVQTVGGQFFDLGLAVEVAK